MRFENKFAVEAPQQEVWDALLDIERVAPCLPGAQVLERTGDDAYKVGIKVKLGPMSMHYKGEVEIVDKDAEHRRAVMSARAKEARGQGMADAQVEMSLAQEGAVTQGTLHADVKLSGKAAAMGQGVIEDVSDKLIETFAGNLEAMLSGGNGAAAGEEAAGAPAPAEGRPAAAPPSPGAAPVQDSLPVGAIAASIAKDRLRDPRAIGAIALLALLVVLLVRSRR